MVRDRTFYFGNFEYNPLGQAAQPGQTVFSPTSAGLSALSGIPGVLILLHEQGLSALFLTSFDTVHPFVTNRAACRLVGHLN